ncbi:MAG: HEAT repeat domain-containing protein [Chloroflexota bacterium]|nr:HEAT repeat domain-containing protein [Chloroflexota bacterium]
MNAASLAMALLSGACMTLVAACGGGGPSSTPTIGSTTSPVVAEPTPTPDLPTVTPTLSPGQGVQTLCLGVQQSYPEIEEEFFLPIAETLQRILVGLGVQVVAEGTPCDATLTIALIGNPLGTAYGSRYFCYTGAEVDGQMTLTTPGSAPLTVPIDEREPMMSGVIYSCPSKTEAPFHIVWRKAVLDALANLSPPHEVFVQALSDEDYWVRFYAARALGEIGPEEGVVPALIQALGDEERAVRENAAWSLGKIGREAVDAVPALAQALGDEHQWVREAAACALRDIGPEAVEAVPALIQALEDEDLPVGHPAAEALEAITGQDFGEDADRWRQWWEEQ